MYQTVMIKRIGYFLKRSSYSEVGVVLVITLIAGFIRIINLDAIPPGLHGDEALTGLDALRILKEGWIGPYVPSALGQPSGPLYWTALILKLGGANVFMIRFAMALLGIVTIPVAYMLYRTLFNKQTALWGTLLLTCSCWHLFYSRTGFMLISLPLAEMLCLLCLFKGLQRKQVIFFVFGGISAGAAIYSYNTFFLFLGAIFLFFCVLVWDAHSFRTPQFRVSQHEVISFWGAFFLTSLPMVIFIVRTSDTFFAHFRINNVFHDAQYTRLDSTVSKLLFLGERFYNSWKVLFYPRGIDAVDGYGTQAIFGPVTGFLFVVGFVYILSKFHDRRHQLILLMVVTGAIAVTLSVPWHGQYRRWVGAIPALFVIPAIALDKITVFFNKRRWRQIGWGVLVVCLGWGAMHNLKTYFTTVPTQAIIRWVYCYDLVQALKYLRQLDDTDLKIYFFSGRWSYNYETRRFLLPEMSGEDRSREFGKFDLNHEVAESSGLFVILSPYQNIIPQLQAKYPNGTLYEHYENKQFIFAVYHLQHYVH